MSRHTRLSEGAADTRLSIRTIVGQVFRIVPGCAAMTLLLITLGVAASLAESIGITLLVLLIYVALAGPAAAVDITGILQTVLTYLGDWSGDSRVFVAVLVVVMIAAKLILTFANAILGSRISNRISELTRNRIFAQLFDVSYSEINRYDRGELLSVLATESFSVAAVHACFIRICVNSGAVLVFAAFLLATSWQITLIAVAGAIIRAAAIRLFSQPITRIGAEAAATNKAMAELILASLQGMRTIRAFAGEAVQKKRFTAVSRAAKTALIRAEQIGCLAGTIGEFMTLGVLAAVLIASAPLGIPFPAVLAAMALIYRLQPHLREFEWQRLRLYEMHASIRLVERMLDKRDKLYPGNGSCTFTGLQQQIRFHNVWFRYPDSTRPSLTHATFSIPAGKRTAIVGPSGAGKTTIVNLMLRLLDPDQGSISVDGVDLAELNRIDWLKHIAVAGQDVDLIEGTVRENITLVCPDVSDRKIAEAVRLAGIEEFIATLPDGFDEWIGDYGLNVSGGQRQRIGLARALVSEPEILILDEATSALDGAIESQIRQRIWRKYGNRTLIVITHRLATIETMDHVICLNSDGQVAEQGAPDVLLSSPDSALAQRVLQENNDADPEPLLTGQIQSF